MMKVQYTICHWAINRTDPQNLLSTILDVPLQKLHQCSFPKNPKHSNETLGLIHSDLLELFTLSYSKYKWVITFLDNYFFYLL